MVPRDDKQQRMYSERLLKMTNNDAMTPKNWMWKKVLQLEKLQNIQSQKLQICLIYSSKRCQNIAKRSD